RINLLVGTNNCGKTSLLEAVHILSARGDASALRRSLARRGEHILDKPNPELAICHLFFGREIKAGSQFSLRGQNDAVTESLAANVIETQVAAEDNSLESEPVPDEDRDVYSSLALSLVWANRSTLERRLPLTPRPGYAENWSLAAPVRTTRTGAPS